LDAAIALAGRALNENNPILMPTESPFWLPHLAGFPVVVVQPVVWGDMDSYRHVNNVVYFRYFENVRLEYVRRLDWFAFEEQTGIGPILAATSARFRRALAYPDQIAIGARMSSMEEDRFFLEHLIISERLGEVATIGQGTVVTYDYRQQKKVPMPEEIKRRILTLEGK
jgi:acyl-CoA thioester hydrolase